MAALVVAALVILLLFLRSRRLPRIHPETDKDARSQFLRIEDYPLNSLPKSADAQEIRHPITQSTVPSTYSLNPLSATSFSTTALLPQTPSSLAHTTDAEPSQPYPETEPPARIDTQPSRDSGYRILEERLATLEAQVAVQQLPPPYVHRD
ncbi:hypothetical protein B0H11DRAFT_1958029 [Mycena galericulata]|nr:hypothetical protein B0H11DRAFT_1958029 [Mycena galericulata]